MLWSLRFNVVLRRGMYGGVCVGVHMCVWIIYPFDLHSVYPLENLKNIEIFLQFMLIGACG